MNIKIFPSKLKGQITAPPSKSYAHRLLICAALAKGQSRISGISGSDDMKATLSCMEALGAKTTRDGQVVFVDGIPGKCSGIPVLNCNESGSTLRFFIPVSLVFADEAVFTGTQRLIERGVGIYEEMLAPSGIRFEKSPAAIKVKGSLRAGSYTMRGDMSSQFASGMLFCLPLLEGDCVLTITEPVESRSYIDITLDALKSFGIGITEGPENTFNIKGGQAYKPQETFVEGDWSNAAFLYAFNSLGSDIKTEGLNENSTQGDKACVKLFSALDEKDPKIDLSDCPDLGPVLFAAAAAKGGGHFTGIRRLRIKESDRARAMADELLKFGITCKINENDMIIEKGELKKPKETLNAHNDHRIAMSLAVLSSITGGEIEGAQAVKKSWPGFFEDMEKLGLKTEKRGQI